MRTTLRALTQAYAGLRALTRTGKVARVALKIVQLRLYAEDIAAAKELAEAYPRGSYAVAIREVLHDALPKLLKRRREDRLQSTYIGRSVRLYKFALPPDFGAVALAVSPEHAKELLIAEAETLSALGHLVEVAWLDEATVTEIDPATAKAVAMFQI